MPHLPWDWIQRSPRGANSLGASLFEKRMDADANGVLP
jgi:hypothetical protein